MEIVCAMILSDFKYRHKMYVALNSFELNIVVIEC